MIGILIALIVLFVGGTLIAMMSDYTNTLAEVSGGILGIIGGVGLLFYIAFAYKYIAAGYKMDIVNTEFQTQYTQAQIFFASDVIDEIRELKRQRIELNGDLWAE